MPQLVWLWICFVTKWSLRGEAPRVLKCKVLQVALLLLTMLQRNCQNRCFFLEKSDILEAVGTPADGARQVSMDGRQMISSPLRVLSEGSLSFPARWRGDLCDESHWNLLVALE
jgi:hypothetical protein